MIDRGQAIVSLDVLIFSNTYNMNEIFCAKTAKFCNDMSLIVVCFFVNFIKLNARS
jgi:hypothetical protein